MENTSRVKLYRWMLDNLNDMSDNEELQEAVFDIFGDYVEQFRRVLDLNVNMLDGIEDRFLVNEDKGTVVDNLRLEITRRRDALSGFLPEEKIDKIVSDIVNSKADDNLFNKLINELNAISNKELQEIKYGNREALDIKEHPQVFLSYAFDDRLYTLCLFFYMLDHGIKLYVDWLFCDEIPDGRDIKVNLTRELEKSRQLLFFRTTRSELHIQGNVELRGWCSWELGVFYRTHAENKDEKYYIELYDYNRGERNRQLDGIKVLKGVAFGRLL